MTPPNDMIMWLREVLITANTQELPDVAARVLAERAILDVHKPMHRPVWPARQLPDGGYTVDYYPNRFDCERCSDDDPRAYACPWPCDTLRWLTYGHRHDAPGWRQEWTPDSAQAAT